MQVGGGRKPGQGCDSVKVVAPSEQRQLAPGLSGLASPRQSACLLSLSLQPVCQCLLRCDFAHPSLLQSHFFSSSSSFLVSGILQSSTFAFPSAYPNSISLLTLSTKGPFILGNLSVLLSESPTNRLIHQGSSLVPPAAFSPH